MHIREATEDDLPTVLRVHNVAFGGVEGAEIADLVEQLLYDPTAKPLVSLVAESHEQVIGHILFTNAGLNPEVDSVSAAILAPLAVLPAAQAQGVGGKLIQTGLETLSASGVGLVFVLGYPDYYTRYGFEPAGRQGLQAPYPIPAKNADAWMVQALQPDILGCVQGTIRCAEMLNQPEYWIE